jgi:hypothetical protein
MSWTQIPAARQKPGELIGGFWVVLQAWHIANLYAFGMLGPEGARVTDGYGNWNVTEVARSVGITEWTGRRNYEMSLDLLLDGWVSRLQRPTLPQAFVGRPPLPAPGAREYRSVGLWLEATCATVEALATTPRGMDTPPSLRIYGAVPHPEVRWVIQTLEWGDVIRDVITGRRLRQQVTLHLVEYNQPTDLQRLPRGKADKARSSAYDW